jgi:hypothetical protein
VGDPKIPNGEERGSNIEEREEKKRVREQEK